MSIKDYYKILEVPPSATPEKIKQSYRRLAFIYHPDKTAGDKQSENKFKEVLEAYTTLSNEHKRINYDYELNKAKQRAKSTPKATAPTATKIYSQEITPQTILQSFADVKKSVASIKRRGKGINQEALYKRLYEMLGHKNINTLHAYGNFKVNRQIIELTLFCCKSLSYIYVKDLSLRLVKLAGADNDSIEDIHVFVMNKKRWRLWEKNKAFAIVAGIFILIIFLLFQLIEATY